MTSICLILYPVTLKFIFQSRALLGLRRTRCLFELFIWLPDRYLILRMVKIEFLTLSSFPALYCIINHYDLIITIDLAHKSVIWVRFSGNCSAKHQLENLFLRWLIPLAGKLASCHLRVQLGYGCRVLLHQLLWLPSRYSDWGPSEFPKEGRGNCQYLKSRVQELVKCYFCHKSIGSLITDPRFTGRVKDAQLSMEEASENW